MSTVTPLTHLENQRKRLLHGAAEVVLGRYYDPVIHDLSLAGDGNFDRNDGSRKTYEKCLLLTSHGRSDPKIP
ncbi:MAG: hypothetical protein GWO20_09420 [Candidatus Korarchaeota archaeon]|nr:hypothetical protein [Candidatus Korarchaeota archaeon]NIU83667.1 hypothetical protein [Candidatus Thorarchaeota archaeon]NIW13885.1 hypothetical protein [Candidatus Thorarchaeota archaeon]NIW51991.1 hypothetical protein [Candidatus Korarchaeota archaeon]